MPYFHLVFFALFLFATAAFCQSFSLSLSFFFFLLCDGGARLHSSSPLFSLSLAASPAPCTETHDGVRFFVREKEKKQKEKEGESCVKDAGKTRAEQGKEKEWCVLIFAPVGGNASLHHVVFPFFFLSCIFYPSHSFTSLSRCLTGGAGHNAIGVSDEKKKKNKREFSSACLMHSPFHHSLTLTSTASQPALKKSAKHGEARGFVCFVVYFHLDSRALPQ